MNIQAINTVSISSIKTPKQKITDEIVIGKDILELLTSAMYVDPLSVFREYIQNATDSIDDAKLMGLFYDNENKPRIHVKVDQTERKILIRDNGNGIKAKYFKRILTSIGGSQKRGTKHRGFRGVGRLSGLGYCQEMTFRSRAPGEHKISEVTWDGRRLKVILNDASWNGSLDDTVKEVTSFSTFSSEDYPPHFFEVELNKVIRFKNDVLLNSDAVQNYIGQVCPVSFHPDFLHGVEIAAYLAKHNTNECYPVYLNEGEEPIYRPHRNSFQIKQDMFDSFSEPKYFEFEGINGDIDAIGWLLEHNYHGAIPKTQGIHGLRFRSGNIQVGSSELVADDAFPESRFNSWSVGEIHILNRKISPNGRRDNFEQNVHFTNLVGKLLPIGREIAKKCRDLSSIRNRIKEFESQNEKVKELISIASHSSTPQRTRKQAKNEIISVVERMKSLSENNSLSSAVTQKFKRRVDNIEKSILTKSYESTQNTLSCLSPTQQKITNEIFELIYAVSLQKNNARLLINKVTKRLIKQHSS